MVKPVESTQNKRLVIFLQYIKTKVLQMLFCSIVIENIQIFYGGPVMFVVTFLFQDWNWYNNDVEKD